MLVNINMKVNSIKAWVLAARPKTLTGAAVPVMLGASHAWYVLRNNLDADTGKRTDDIGLIGWIPLILCFLFAFIMQINANFINDYYDCIKGRDNNERLGPLRACQQGWVTLPAMRNAIIITSILACAVGLPLIYWGGVELIAIGIACLVFCFLYTTCLAEYAMGDILVLVFFGIIPCCFTYYVIVPPEFQNTYLMPWTLGIANGLVTDTLLIVNNYRDIDNDRNSGKKTLIVYIGRKKAEWLYICLVPVALVLILLEYGYTNLNLILCFGVYFFHVGTWNEMRKIQKGKALNGVLGKTARNILIFGVLITLLIIFV